MAAAPTILESPQLAVSTDLNDVTWLRACELRGRLTISLDGTANTSSSRLSLSEWIHSEIEAQLLRVGASASTSSVHSDAHTQLFDQVYRARFLGYAGVSVALRGLQNFSVENVLNAKDSWALLDFCQAAHALQVELRLDQKETQVCAIPRPVQLEKLIPDVFAASELEGLPQATPTPPPESAASRVAEETSAPSVKEPGAIPAARSLRAAMQDLLKDELGTLDDLETPIPQASVKPAAALEPQAAPPKTPAAAPVGAITPTPQPTPVFDASSMARAEKLIRELQTTDGTCGWEEIEQRFTESYLPLQQLVPTLANPTNAERALSQWSAAFEDSYREAFEALRTNRGKRPRLVLDVPTHSFQLSRKLEIEQCKLVLVDAMRADLAPIVLDKLRLQMTHTAECVADGLLWSALPSTTAAQMELIARGTDSLRHFTGELSEEQLLSRGNDLRKLRPVRVGSHRMYKLDIVQYLTRDATSHDRSKLEQYAAEIATSVGRFLRQQAPNTLIYVFGDHGFGGASEASPENVLVPYFAWRLLA